MDTNEFEKLLDENLSEQQAEAEELALKKFKKPFEKLSVNVQERLLKEAFEKR